MSLKDEIHYIGTLPTATGRGKALGLLMANECCNAFYMDIQHSELKTEGGGTGSAVHFPFSSDSPAEPYGPSLTLPSHFPLTLHRTYLFFGGSVFYICFHVALASEVVFYTCVFDGRHDNMFSFSFCELDVVALGSLRHDDQ